MRVAVLVAIFCRLAVAGECAEEKPHFRLGELEIRGLQVKGSDGVLELGRADSWCRVERLKDRIRVTLIDDCGSVLEPHEYSAGELAGRLANNAGMKRFRRGEFAEAAADFRRAVALDPGSDRNLGNLASALNRLGQRQQALDSLAPLMARNLPLALYKLWTDDDLKGLAPALQGTGTVEVAQDGFRDGKRRRTVAVQPDRHWLAALDYGESCCTDDVMPSLEILTEDGKTLHALSLGCHGSECRDRTDETRIANRLLRELGFVLTADTVDIPPRSDEPWERKIGGYHIRLTQEEALQVKQGGKWVGMAFDRVHYVTLVPSRKLIIYSWFNPNIPEGCNSAREFNGIGVMRLR